MEALFNFNESTHWECPKCTLLCPVKSLRCTMCLYRRPRGQKPTTPTTRTEEDGITPENPVKFSKKTRRHKSKTKRHIGYRKQHGVSARKAKAKAITSTTKRNRDRVDSGMQERKKKKKKNSKNVITLSMACDADCGCLSKALAHCRLNVTRVFLQRH